MAIEIADNAICNVKELAFSGTITEVTCDKPLDPTEFSAATQ
jgi:hypothetical protein